MFWFSIILKCSKEKLQLFWRCLSVYEANIFFIILPFNMSIKRLQTWKFVWYWKLLNFHPKKKKMVRRLSANSIPWCPKNIPWCTVKRKIPWYDVMLGIDSICYTLVTKTFCGRDNMSIDSEVNASSESSSKATKIDVI